MARPRRRVSVATSASRAVKPGARGRPTAERAAAIDEVIRSVALDLFLAVGFEAVSMDAITAAARVSKGTLYARYPNKEILFLSVLQRERARLSEQASGRNHLMPGDLEGRLRHHAQILIQAAQNPVYKRVLQLVESNAASFPELARRWSEDGTLGYLQLLSRSMAEAASPAQRAIDWDFVANLFLHGISGWLRTQSSLQTLNEASATAYADEVIAVVMAWIRERSCGDTNLS